MNIYDRRTEASKNYTPLPEVKIYSKKIKGLAIAWAVLIFVALGCLIASPGFFFSYRGNLFCAIFLIVLLNIFAIPSLKYQHRFLTETQLYHDCIFASYRSPYSTPLLSARALLTMAAVDLIMGNTENAKFAFEQIDSSLLKPKSLDVYEKVKAHIENNDSGEVGFCTLEDLLPRQYRRMKSARPAMIFFVIAEVLIIGGMIFSTILHLLIAIEGG